MKYPLVAFDFDGTLADSLPWFFEAVTMAADKFGFKRVELAEREHYRGLDTREIVKRLGVPFWKLPAIASEMKAMAAQVNFALFPGTLGLLGTLKANGHTLAIVTSNSRENVERNLGEAARLIEHWECGATLFGKSRKLTMLLKKSGFRPHQAIYIGDELRDLEAAKKSRMACGAVTWGYALAEALGAREPTEIFSSMDEIPGRVR